MSAEAVSHVPIFCTVQIAPGVGTTRRCDGAFIATHHAGSSDVITAASVVPRCPRVRQPWAAPMAAHSFQAAPAPFVATAQGVEVVLAGGLVCGFIIGFMWCLCLRPRRNRLNFEPQMARE